MGEASDKITLGNSYTIPSPSDTKGSNSKCPILKNLDKENFMSIRMQKAENYLRQQILATFT